MPVWLAPFALKASGFLKRYWPYILATLALVAVYLWIDHRGYQRGFHSRDTEVARITQDRDTYKENAATLQASLDRQNAAVSALKADADKRAQEGAKARDQARRANAGLLEQAEALRKSGGKTMPKDWPCVPSADLVKVGKL